jgi:tyrosyl-tRNA synthetase
VKEAARCTRSPLDDFRLKSDDAAAEALGRPTRHDPFAGPNEGESLALAAVPKSGSNPSKTAAFLERNAVDSLPRGELERKLEHAAGEGRPLRAKLGIDPTAPDIHLGHTVVLQKLREFQDAGHHVVLIIGDFTGRVGDPSGRSVLRPMLAPAEIEHNALTFQDQAFKVLDRDRTEVRRNGEWLDMPMDDLFRLVRTVTLARVTERDDFSQRLAEQQPISLLELLYPVLQGYDSVAVGADVELGGTDQKFNLLLGRDVQQAYGRPQQAILTMPILPGLDGERRMSKSLGNYVGVTDAPEEMFGKLMSLPDEAMAIYYELLLGEEMDRASAPVQQKRTLARRIVERFHDAGAAAAAEELFDRVHKQHEVPDDIPEVELSPAELQNGLVHLPALLAAHFGTSRSEARRLLAQGGVRLDGEPLGEADLDLPPERLVGAVLQVGRRKFRRIARLPQTSL